ncbi:MAG: hypothetical protein U0575_09065 [Phycisphaerales bacterium]
MNKRSLGFGMALLTFAAAGTMLAMAPFAAQPASQPLLKANDDGEMADHEQAITLETAPEAVRTAAVKLAGDAKNITKVVREEDDEDGVTFEIEFNDGGTKSAAVYSSGGELMELERAVAEAKLPAAVLAALKKDYPTATFADPQIVTKTYYEIDVVIDGRKREIKVDPAGNIKDKANAKRGDDDRGKGNKGEGKKREKEKDDDDND